MWFWWGPARQISKKGLPVNGEGEIFLLRKYSDCQKFFAIGDLIVGAQRAVPSTSGTARRAPIRRNYIWQTL